MSSYSDNKGTFDDRSDPERTPSFSAASLPESESDGEIPPPNLKIKHVNSKYDERSGKSIYEDVPEHVLFAAELVHPVGDETTDVESDWSKYCFVVVRHHSLDHRTKRVTITVSCCTMDDDLITVCRQVMHNVRGISWHSKPLTVSIIYTSQLWP